MSEDTGVVHSPRSHPTGPSISQCNAIDQHASEDTGIAGSAPKVDAFHRTGYFKFLSLPPEIRNVIYWFYLVEPFPLQIHDKELCRFDSEAAAILVKKDLALFRVNRQIWREASPVFYAQNIFSFCLDAAGKPKPSEEGFHPNLERMRKCHLWKNESDDSLDGTRAERLQAEAADVYAKSLIDAFVDALTEHERALVYLLVSLPCFDLRVFTPLARLCKIRQLQIKSTEQYCKRIPVFVQNLALLQMGNWPWPGSSIADMRRSVNKEAASNTFKTDNDDVMLATTYFFQDERRKSVWKNDDIIGDDQEFEEMKAICGF